MSVLRLRPALLAVVLAAALLALCFCPQSANTQDTPSIRIISLLGFDPTIGKQHPVTQFIWPDNKQVAALLRYETSGYTKRKSVEIFWEILNEEGRQLSKHSETVQAHSGKHEAPLPIIFHLDEMFGTRRLTYRVELKLVGGERLEKYEEFGLSGPQIPQINFGRFIILPATDSGADALKPGGRFAIRGTVSISGNTSGRRPSLVAWALMNGDTLQDDPWNDEPFSDLYWDWAQFDADNGEWEFEVHGRLPEQFLPGESTERGFSAFAVVSFGENRASRTTASAVIGGVNPETMTSGNLDERLIRLERNWDWSITAAAGAEPVQEGAEWPQQK